MIQRASERPAQGVLDVVVPRPRSPGGVRMAGFRSCGAVSLDVIPYPAVTVFFDLGDSPLYANGGVSAQQAGSTVVGVAPKSLSGHGTDIECLQVRLSPLLAGKIGIPPDLCGAVGLAEVWGSEASLIEGRLRRTGSWDERFAIAAEAIGRRAQDARAPDAEIAYAWRRTTASRGSVRVGELAVEIEWSRKRLWSRFRTQTGLTPKGAARLIRFDRAVHLLAGGHRPAVVATECGYADQAHLSRDVAEFTGTPPTSVAHAPWLDVDPVAWPEQGAR